MLYLSLSPLGYFNFSPLFSHTVPLLRGINTGPEWTIYYGGRTGGVGSENTNLTINLLLDCVLHHNLSPLLISSPICRCVFQSNVCTRLNQWFTFPLSHHSLHLKTPVQCFKGNIDYKAERSNQLKRVSGTESVRFFNYRYHQVKCDNIYTSDVGKSPLGS